MHRLHRRMRRRRTALHRPTSFRHDHPRRPRDPAHLGRHRQLPTRPQSHHLGGRESSVSGPDIAYLRSALRRTARGTTHQLVTAPTVETSYATPSTARTIPSRIRSTWWGLSRSDAVNRTVRSPREPGQPSICNSQRVVSGGKEYKSPATPNASPPISAVHPISSGTATVSYTHLTLPTIYSV